MILALLLLACGQEPGKFTTETERHYGLGDRKEADVSVEFYPSGKIVRRERVPSGSVARIPKD